MKIMWIFCTSFMNGFFAKKGLIMMCVLSSYFCFPQNQIGESTPNTPQKNKDDIISIMLTSQKSTEKSVLFIAEEAIIKGDIFIELYEKIPAELPKKKQKNVKKKLMEIKNPRKASSETKKIYQTKANQISPKNPDNTTALLYGKVQTAIGCTNDYRLKTIVDLYYFLALLEIKYDAHLVAFYMFVFFAGACSASAFIRPPPYSNYHSIIKILLPKYFTLINK